MYGYPLNPTITTDPLGLSQTSTNHAPTARQVRQSVGSASRGGPPARANPGDHAMRGACFNNERIRICEERINEWLTAAELDGSVGSHPVATFIFENIRAGSIYNVCVANNICSLIDSSGNPIPPDSPALEIWPPDPNMITTPPPLKPPKK